MHIRRISVANSIRICIRIRSNKEITIRILSVSVRIADIPKYLSADTYPLISVLLLSCAGYRFAVSFDVLCVIFRLIISYKYSCAYYGRAAPMAPAFRQPSIDISANVSILFVSSVMW